jgi:hypothetical protein
MRKSDATETADEIVLILASVGFPRLLLLKYGQSPFAMRHQSLSFR